MMEFKFDFDDTHFGSFDSKKMDIRVSLGCFKNSAMRNNGYGNGRVMRRVSKRTSLDQIIKDISYTIQHEYIHLAAMKQHRHKCMESEHIAYYMVGNGGNMFVHEFYTGLKEKKSWTRYL